jgi:hypothetical protein
MSPAPVELIPMLCLKCQQPVLAQTDEVVWYCQNCGQGMLLSDDQGMLPQVFHFSGGIAANAQGKPVWVVAGTVTMQRETFSGDNSRDSQQFWAQPRWFFIPAYSLTLDQLVESGLKFLKEPLALQESGSAAPFLAVTIHPEDLLPLAEFIIMAVEAERRDQLQSINFSLQLGQPELWIFP